MYEDAIRFTFPSAQSAFDAFETLQELGYEPVIDDEDGCSTLHIHVERSDVTSALEIAQTHGGELQEQAPHNASIYAWQGQGILGIPAHTVNEDFTEDYASGASQAYLDNE
jgi:hypothetical protein